MRENAAERAGGTPCPTNLISGMFGHCHATPATSVGMTEVRLAKSQACHICHANACGATTLFCCATWTDMIKSVRFVKNISKIGYFQSIDLKRLKIKTFNLIWLNIVHFGGTRFHWNVQCCKWYHKCNIHMRKMYKLFNYRDETLLTSQEPEVWYLQMACLI